ncbi:uncharacterized protein MYCFIDRAFT_206848 [Pseudocercospora fijiensis CIRAD86]|uniref:Uncharacterized protein n=1 Tax=Pseudocercospora fijiensis (strain CIRAD86) TaxID=383855 RepID=M3A604_PSEFD|nr:uncharacterized protein MYCFIDRAFT_206848 [Pseudocercospora fijiensis CIRAD86]EME86549.1 hypothetical protein MYCFIDRAFT_206848 [Pseudocercospora fijiensis CIRAD86]
MQISLLYMHRFRWTQIHYDHVESVSRSTAPSGSLPPCLMMPNDQSMFVVCSAVEDQIGFTLEDSIGEAKHHARILVLLFLFLY